MASDGALTSPWPHGQYYPITLGPITWGAGELGDTTGAIKVACFKTPFAFNVKKAFLWTGHDFLDGSGNIAAISITDTDSQTLVAAYTALEGTVQGVWTDLTVADEGPVLNNAEVYLNYDSDAAGEGTGIAALLWVSPTHAPVGSIRKVTS